MAVGATTGTNTNSGFGKVVKDNLQAGITTTTLYAQWNSISFVFNRQTYSVYNGEVLQVLQGHSDYLSSTVSSDYTSTITYKTSSGTNLSSAPTTVGNYIATITVSKGSQTRGAVDLPFAVIEGDFGKLPSGTSGKWGSETNPYVISTSVHLANLSGIVNGTQIALNTIVGSDGGAVTADDVVATDNTYANCYFVVTADIDMSGISNFAIIGTQSKRFGAKQFDFQGFDILNLTLSDSGEVGLFGYLKGIAILSTGSSASNPTVFSGARTSTGDYVGALAGFIENGVISGYFRNECAITGNLNYVGGFVGRNHADTSNGRFYNYGEVVGKGTSTGGIFGFTGSQLIDSENHGNVTGVNAVGGITGRNQGTITGCKNYGVVKSTANGGNTGGEVNNVGAAVGGISGYSNSDVINCHNYGKIDAANVNAVGGILGVAGLYSNNAWTGCKVENCTNEANVTAKNHVGGIVGYAAMSNLSNNENVANTTIIGDFFVGGIAGGIVDSTIVTNCTNNGAVGNNNSIYVGGIAGYGEGVQINESHNHTAVQGNNYVGGIVGKISSGSVTACANNGNVSGKDYIGGVVGNAKDITVSGCTNSENVTSSGTSAIAGIVGGLEESATIEIKNCENSGTISAGNANGVAGILGHTNADSCNNAINVSNCKNTGTVIGSRNAGGIGGRIETIRTTSTSASLIFRNCYNSGNISATPNGTVGGIVGYLYANGGSAANIAVVLYCFNQGTISGKNNIGGIVGNPNQTANKAAVRIGYSYTTYGQVAGTSNATVDATAYTIATGTNAPSNNNGGSSLLYNESTTTFDYPLVDGTQTTWENIVTQNINGFRLTTNVAEGDYYESLKGVGGALLNPDNFTSVGSSSFVVEAKYTAEQGNIYLDTADIVLVSKTVTYDKQAHTIAAPTLPDDYTFTTLYFTTADAFTDGKRNNEQNGCGRQSLLHGNESAYRQYCCRTYGGQELRNTHNNQARTYVYKHLDRRTLSKRYRQSDAKQFRLQHGLQRLAT